MNFLDAAYEVLKQAQEPLRYTEITARALSAGLIVTKGQTPESTMGSRLYVDVKRPNSRFRQVGRGVFTLAEQPSSSIKQRIDTLNRQTRSQLQKRLMQMSPERFEVLVGELLRALGFEEETIEVTTYRGDGGVDVRGVLNVSGITKINAAVQAKKWKRNIHAPTVQALRGSLTVHEQGIIITTSQFSKGAIAEAQAPGKVPISLIDGKTLISLLLEHSIGVTSDQHTVYSLHEEWWSEVVLEETEVVAETILPQITYPCPIRATARGQTFEAQLLDASGRVLYNGVEYKSPSGACMAATEWKSCNGWTVWRYQNPKTGNWHAIDELRRK